MARHPKHTVTVHPDEMPVHPRQVVMRATVILTIIAVIAVSPRSHWNESACAKQNCEQCGKITFHGILLLIDVRPLYFG
jgi:hypothetical protein